MDPKKPRTMLTILKYFILLPWPTKSTLHFRARATTIHITEVIRHSVVSAPNSREEVSDRESFGRHSATARSRISHDCGNEFDFARDHDLQRIPNQRYIRIAWPELR